LCFSFVAISAFHYVSHLTLIILIIIVYRKKKAETTATLTKTLPSTQSDIDIAEAKLKSVESQQLEGISRIEASERRVENLRLKVESAREAALGSLIATSELPIYRCIVI
jgi:hypothetical protein